MIASHIIFGCYGFWLPNDPRGAWSDYVRNRNIFEFGEVNQADTRRSVAHVGHNWKSRISAKRALRYPPVILNTEQIDVVADGFATAVKESDYYIAACAIMPDHVHFVVGRHSNIPKKIMSHIKTRATQELIRRQLHPFQYLTARPSMWARNGWVVYIANDAQLHAAVEYVNHNPVQAGLALQKWNFVSTEN